MGFILWTLCTVRASINNHKQRQDATCSVFCLLFIEWQIPPFCSSCHCRHFYVCVSVHVPHMCGCVSVMHALFFFLLLRVMKPCSLVWHHSAYSFNLSFSLLPSIPPYLWFASLLFPHPIDFPILLFSDPTLSEYGPHRLPVSLVCRRLQRLLLLSDPPGQGRRTVPSVPATSSTENTAQQAAAADPGPPAGYHLLPACIPALLKPPDPCACLFHDCPGLLL